MANHSFDPQIKEKIMFSVQDVNQSLTIHACYTNIKLKKYQNLELEKWTRKSRLNVKIASDKRSTLPRKIWLL